MSYSKQKLNNFFKCINSIRNRTSSHNTTDNTFYGC